MQRARKVERFLSQPFFVAEEFTGRSGEYVPVAETIRGFKEIIEGQHDEVPERAFFMKGGIDQVSEDARASGAHPVPGRGAHARGPGLRRRGRDALDPHRGRRDRRAREPHAAARDAAAGRPAAAHERDARSSTTRRARATSRCTATTRWCWSRTASSRSRSTAPSRRSACARPRRCWPRRRRRPTSPARACQQALRDKRRAETFLRIAGGESPTGE